MVNKDAILKLSKQMMKRRENKGSPNVMKGKRFEVTKRQYLAMKGNAREMAKKNMELARHREMKKLKDEVKQMTISDAQRILRRMIRQSRA